MAKVFNRFVKLVERIPTIDGVNHLFYSVIKHSLTEDNAVDLVSHLKEVFLDGKESLHYEVSAPVLGATDEEMVPIEELTGAKSTGG